MTVQIEKVKEIVKFECVKCNLHQRKYKNDKCKDCAFIFNSASKKGKLTRVGVGKELVNCGVDKRFAKYHLFYFLWNPILDFKFPPLPNTDMSGRIRDGSYYSFFNKTHSDIRKFYWLIHHENGIDTDDSPWNLLLILNTEHGFFHRKINSHNKFWDDKIHKFLEE